MSGGLPIAGLARAKGRGLTVATPGVVRAIRTCAAGVGGLLIAWLAAAAFGYPPLAVMTAFAQAIAGGAERVAAVLLVACPLVLTGLAVAVAFRCGVWNIGAEGQYLLGAAAAAAVGGHAAALPGWLAIPLTLLAGVAGGAAWAAIAAWLKLARGVSDVLSTILLNFVAVQLLSVLVHGPLSDPASAARDTTAVIARSAQLPQAAASGLHAGVALAVVIAPLVWFFLRQTVWGLRIRIVGANPVAARLARIRVGRYAAASFLLSGGLAGLAGGVELAGNSRYLTANYGAGYGYTAIAVAMLARLSPVGVLPAAIYFAVIDVGVRGLQFTDVPGIESFPSALTFAAQGAVVLLTAWMAGPPARMDGD